MALSVSMIVSISSTSTPPSMSPRTCSANASFIWSKVTARNAGSLTSGEIDSVLLVGPDRAGHEPRLVGRRPFVGGLSRELRRLDVQLVHERLERVVGLRDGRAAERVGLDDVGARLEILLVNSEDDVGTRQHEHVVVAAQLLGMRREALAAEILFGQLVALDHRAHRAVEHEDALRPAGVRVGFECLTYM